MKITFFKYSAQGNDFIIIDNRQNFFDDSQKKEFWAKLAKRKEGIGSDGIILLENAERADFKMRYYDADGGQSELCANGGRSILHFADKTLGMNRGRYKFETKEGFYEGRVYESGVIELSMNSPEDENKYDLSLFNEYSTHYFINTGVPHAFFEVQDLQNFPVVERGREIRFHQMFEKGSNVNFFTINSPTEVTMRTYERGVEDETLACGTGACGIAVYLNRQNPDSKKIQVHMPGGSLAVDLTDGVQHMKISGPVIVTYQGTFQVEDFI